jgi:hypothetical protein
VAAATLRTDDADWQEVEVEPGGLRVLTAFRGTRCTVQVTGFYDTNRDGHVNPGDLVATSPPIGVEDRGILRGNMTVGPRMHLTAIK